MTLGTEMENEKIKIDESDLKIAFKYIGVQLLNHAKNEAQSDRKLMASNVVFHTKKRLLKQNALKRTAKLNIIKIMRRN